MPQPIARIPPACQPSTQRPRRAPPAWEDLESRRLLSVTTASPASGQADAGNVALQVTAAQQLDGQHQNEGEENGNHPGDQAGEDSGEDPADVPQGNDQPTGPPTGGQPRDNQPADPPPTDPPPTDPPPTVAPPTVAPPTDAPPTVAPPTDAPPTVTPAPPNAKPPAGDGASTPPASDPAEAEQSPGGGSESEDDSIPPPVAQPDNHEPPTAVASNLAATEPPGEAPRGEPAVGSTTPSPASAEAHHAGRATRIPPLFDASAALFADGSPLTGPVEAIVDAVAASAPAVSAAVARLAEVLRGGAAAADVIAAAPSYQFATVNAATTFYDALARFMDECAALAPAVLPPGALPAHRRAWGVTVAVIAVDVALVAYALHRRRRNIAGSLPADFLDVMT